MKWFGEGSLFDYLENLSIEQDGENHKSRFQVQYVIRPQSEEFHDYRGYAGSLLSGSFRKGDHVSILPLEGKTTIDRIEKHQREIEIAHAGEPIVIHLADDFDVSRGTTIVKSSELPISSDLFEATICWMDNKSFQKGQKLLLQHHSFRVKAVIKEIISEIDIHTFEEIDGKEHLNPTDICKVLIKTAEPIHYDIFRKNRNIGSLILINENSNNTVAAGVILD